MIIECELLKAKNDIFKLLKFFMIMATIFFRFFSLAGEMDSGEIHTNFRMCSCVFFPMQTNEMTSVKRAHRENKHKNGMIVVEIIVPMHSRWNDVKHGKHDEQNKISYKPGTH